MRIGTFFSAALTSVLLVGAAAADSAFLTVGTLRQMAYAQQADALEEALGQTQGAYLAGDVSADEFRELFTAFGASHPDMVGFVETWVGTHPDSAHAQAARAWSLYNGAWAVRGGRYASQTHPEALAVYRAMIGAADIHAQRAFDLNPDLIAASDARIVMVHISSDEDGAYDAFDYVMSTRPNWGKLRRAQRFAHPGYGGSSAMLDALCHNYGDMLPDEGVDQVFRCLYFGARSHYKAELSEWLEQNMEQAASDPILDVSRADLLTRLDLSKSRTDDQVAFARETILNDDYLDTRLSSAFDNAFQYNRQLPATRQAYVARNYERAKQELEHDPLNPRLMEIVSSWYYRPLSSDMSKDEKEALFQSRRALGVDFASRTLIAAPYDSQNWYSYAGQFPYKDDPQSYFAGEPYLINAIAYAVDQPGALFSYLRRKTVQAAELEWFAQGNGSPDWQAFARETDASTQVYCPVLRAHRVLEQACLLSPSAEQYCGPDLSKEYRTVVEIALNDPSCAAISVATDEELAFSPVPIDWMSDPSAMTFPTEF